MVAKLEGALEAFGDATGPEVTVIQESLKSGTCRTGPFSPYRSLSASSLLHGR